MLFITEKKTQKGRVFERQFIVTCIEDFISVSMEYDLRGVGFNNSPDVYVYTAMVYTKSGGYCKALVYVPIVIFEEIVKSDLLN